tara:strand:+ start:351 stop:2372 length:2022 start_codon:yes stop_codon:yes gene_type:complete
MTDPITQSMMQGAAGAGGDNAYVEDAFSVDMYLGSGVDYRLIENGLDLGGSEADSGGMVIVKCASNSDSWYLRSSAISEILQTNTNEINSSTTAYIRSLETNGFKLGSNNDTNGNGRDTIAFSFKTKPGFFAQATWTGNGVLGRDIAHDLGCVPGMIWVKRLDGAENWMVYHRSLGATKYMVLNGNFDQGTANTIWNDTAPTSTVFTLGDAGNVNATGGTYVAFLFGDGIAGGGDAVKFGDNADQSMIKCGTYTGSSANNYTQHIDLGWTPQFVMYKNVDDNENWRLSTKALTYGAINSTGDGSNQCSDTPHLAINEPDAVTENARFNVTGAAESTKGFSWYGESRADCNGNGKQYIWIAIRDAIGEVSKEFTDGTKVFQPALTGQNDPTPPGSFLTYFGKTGGTGGDFAFARNSTSGDDTYVGTRFWGPRVYRTNSTSAPAASSSWQWDSSEGVLTNYASANKGWVWRDSKAFQQIWYHGTGTNLSLKHDLGKVPEMIWISNQQDGGERICYHFGGAGDGVNPQNYKYFLTQNGGADNASVNFWQQTAPTATQFTVGIDGDVNGVNDNMSASLFTSVDGISKCGYYSGSGASGKAITTGFQPRFILIKRADSTSNWNYWDSVRGWANGLYLNATDAQQNIAWVDVSSTGFSLITDNSNVNDSSGKYIYYAHA